MSKKLKLKKNKKLKKTGPEPFILNASFVVVHGTYNSRFTNYIMLCVFLAHNKNYLINLMINFC